MSLKTATLALETTAVDFPLPISAAAFPPQSESFDNRRSSPSFPGANSDKMASGTTKTRDVKNHLLFEIATEVAHRGKLSPVNFPASLQASNDSPSWWYLLRPQVQGPSDDRRIWRSIYPHRSPEPRIGVYSPELPPSYTSPTNSSRPRSRWNRWSQPTQTL